MPGNKNSGRKRRASPDIDLPDIRAPPPKTRKKIAPLMVSPPRKTRQGTILAPAATPSNSSQPKPSTSKSHRLAAMEFETTIGPSLSHFPQLRLPQKRTILQRWKGLQIESNFNKQVTIRDHARSMWIEIKAIWQASRVPLTQVGDKTCIDKIVDIITGYQNLNRTPKKRRSEKYQAQINSLFDLSVGDDAAVEVALKASRHPDWEEDLIFYRGQKQYPQLYSMGGVDLKLAVTESRAAARRAQEKKRTVKEAGRTATVTSVSSLVIVPSEKEDEAESAEEARQALSDPDAQLPRYVTYQKQPTHVILKLPTRSLSQYMTSLTVGTRTSLRTELKTIAALYHIGGADFNQTKMSVTTVHRQRIASVKAYAAKDKDHFLTITLPLIHWAVVHWDGKVLQYVNGLTDDRCAIGISAPGVLSWKFLASPVIAASTGEEQAFTVNRILRDWRLANKIIGFCFDTTASNSGEHKGAAKILEELLGPAVFWLACRHHVGELHIRHANNSIRGKPPGPRDRLFTRFQEAWRILVHNENHLNLWDWPEDPTDYRHERATDVKLWLEDMMRRGVFARNRDDYREVMECAAQYLGAQVVRPRCHGAPFQPGFRMRKPGAVSTTRFMQQAIYLLKIAMLQGRGPNQFYVTHREEQCILAMAEYIVLFFVPHYLQARFASAAPRLDRELWVNLKRYEVLHAIGSKERILTVAAMQSVKRHLWYLTEECIVFCLFDEELADAERHLVADRLRHCPHPPQFATGKPRAPDHNRLTANPLLSTFVGPRSWLLFELTGAGSQWLQSPVAEWPLSADYLLLHNMIRDLEVVNDGAERSIKDVTEYANVTQDGTMRDDYIVVANCHRDVFHSLKRDALGNLKM